jgi:hypothetical protein
MKDESQRHKHMIAVVAIVGGGGVLLIVLARGTSGARVSSSRAPSSSTRHPGGAIAPHSINFGPNPAQPQLDAAIIAAREAALAAYDQSSVAEHSTTAQYQLGINQDVTAKAIAANTNATQLKEAGIQSTMEQAIAAEEAAVQRQQIAAQQSVASQYASAQQTQAQGSFWGNILGGVASFLPFLGFNATGSGTGYVDEYGNPAAGPSSISIPIEPQDPYSAINALPALPGG